MASVQVLLAKICKSSTRYMIHWITQNIEPYTAQNNKPSLSLLINHLWFSLVFASMNSTLSNQLETCSARSSLFRESRSLLHFLFISCMTIPHIYPEI